MPPVLRWTADGVRADAALHAQEIVALIDRDLLAAMRVGMGLRATFVEAAGPGRSWWYVQKLHNVVPSFWTEPEERPVS